MAKDEFIYRVSFTEPPFEGNPDKTDFFFGSLSAIYQIFTPKQIGCKVTRLWNLGVSDGKPYTNRQGTVTVAREPLERKHSAAKAENLPDFGLSEDDRYNTASE